MKQAINIFPGRPQVKTLTSERIAEQTRQFEMRGGMVKSIPRGVTGDKTLRFHDSDGDIQIERTCKCGKTFMCARVSKKKLCTVCYFGNKK